MRLVLALVLVFAGCAAKKPAAKHGGQVENKQNELDKDKDDRNDKDSRDDKDDADPKRGGDPCEGGE